MCDCTKIIPSQYDQVLYISDGNKGFSTYILNIHEVLIIFYFYNSFTYEVAPVFVLIENEVLRGLRQLIGWAEGDGIFCPGGSTSNMYAMNLARYQLFPDVKSQGLCGLPRLTVFTSSEVRDAHSKAARGRTIKKVKPSDLFVFSPERCVPLCLSSSRAITL